MPFPIVPIAAGAIVVGDMLFSTSDRGSSDEIMNKVGFNHPQKFTQINEGQDTGGLHQAITGWGKGIAGDFDEVARLLDEANSKAGVAWEGRAAEEHGKSLAPMTEFIRDAKTVSEQVGSAAQDQTTAFGDVRSGMPQPVKVDATDNMAEKAGAYLIGGETDLQQQEREATEKAQEAKRVYEAYDQTIADSQRNTPQYQKPPEMGQDQGQGSFDRSGAINSPMGVGSGGGPGAGGSSGGIGGVGGGSGIGSGGSSVPDTPAGSGSSWSPSPGSVSPLPAAGPGPVGTGGGGAGGGAGMGMMPGGMGAGGAGAGGAGAGGRAGAGGMGAGRAGAGAGAANQPGAGGRSGVGTPGGGMGGAGAGAGGAGAKGPGAGGRGGMGGGMGAGRGGQGGEDDEHEHPSWLEEQDDVWLNDMPRTAPPVFGE